MGEQFVQQKRVDFWLEVKRMRGNNKYENLYTSVPYDPDEMARLRQAISTDVYRHVDDECSSHAISFRTYHMQLKRSKRESTMVTTATTQITSASPLYVTLAVCR